MVAHGQGQGIWAAVVCSAALALAGCGADGTSSVYFPANNPGPSVSGTVYTPCADGQFVTSCTGGQSAAERWWQWAHVFWSMPRVYAALQSEFPVTSEENVSLSQLDPAQAAHGRSSPALLLGNGSTRSDGTYSISNDQLASFQAGQIIVQLGSDQAGTLTRAFVISCTTDTTVSCTADIDAVSEGVVHVVLDYVAGNTDHKQLSDFSKADLENIDCMARVLTAGISGTGGVADINENVYNRLIASPTMQNCLQHPGQCQCS
jgi:hypothetical protein